MKSLKYRKILKFLKSENKDESLKSRMKKFGSFHNQSDTGFSMIEVILAIGLLFIVMPLVATMTSISLQTREVAENTTQHILSRSAIHMSLNNDIKRASAINISEDGSQISLKSGDGLCKAWKIEDNMLLRAQSNEAITGDSKWKIISEKINSSSNAFTYSNQGIVDYEFEYDMGAGEIIYGSEAIQVAKTGSGVCW